MLSSGSRRAAGPPGASTGCSLYLKGIALLFKRLAGLTCAGLLAGCAFGLSASAASAGTIAGAGSTLVAPIEAEWAAAFDSATGNTVTYNAVGSGTGYKDIANGLVDFGASDAPLSSYSNPPGNLVQIPWSISAVGISYHLHGISRLHLTGRVIAAIYTGQIKNWNDSRIASLNRRLHLPNLPITPFWRSDGSGTTYVFTKYESEISPTFSHRIGNSTTVSWPVGQGAKGNTGMAQAVARTNGAIAYIEVAYLIADRLPAASVQNAAGRWTVPNLFNISAAANTAHSVPGNNEINITNPGPRARSAYPISGYTYVFVPTNARQGTLLRQFIGYAITGGQQFAPRLDYVPIPGFVRARDQSTLNSIQ
jgi:phosphate transport system substrate-binding protein